jgi:fructokinase
LPKENETEMTHLWGIDLGGTKIEGVVLDAAGGAVATRSRVPTESEKGYEHILEQIERLLIQLEEDTGLPRPRRIGIGTPGTVDPASELMKNCNTTCLNGRPLPSDLEQLLGTELRLANDANCFALAEANLGAAKGAEVVFGVILGTGVGGGIVVHGRVLNGLQGIAGEWGHNVLEPDGEPCYCGKRGCVETVLSGPSLERWYAAHSGRRRGLREIVQLSDEDVHASATVERLVGEFGRAIAAVVNVLDPDVVVLGGGVGQVRALQERAVEAMRPWVFNTSVRTRVAAPKLGDSAGVFGAAMLTSDSKASFASLL